MRTEIEGIILRQTKTVGGRRMLLIFSKQLGKISASTGINEKSRKASSLAVRPFTYGRYRLFKSRGAYTIDYAESIKSYYGLGEDIDKYMNSSYVLELTDKLLTEGQPAPALFNLILDFFDAMENRSKRHETLVLAYQVKAMKILGIEPVLNRCVQCGTSEDLTKFSVTEGGVICKKCAVELSKTFDEKKTNSKMALLIYDTKFGIVDIINYFMKTSLRDLKNLALKEDVQDYLRSLLRDYYSYHLDINQLKSEAFLNE